MDPVETVEQPAVETPPAETPAVVPTVEEDSITTPEQDFMAQYEELCTKTGMAIKFRVEHKMNEDNSFDGGHYIVNLFVAPK